MVLNGIVPQVSFIAPLIGVQDKVSRTPGATMPVASLAEEMRATERGDPVDRPTQRFLDF